MYMERISLPGAERLVPGRPPGMEHAYRRAITEAHRLRSEMFLNSLKFLWRVVSAPAVGVWRWFSCGNTLARAEKELGSLSDNALRDIGVSRSEISWRVRQHSPCGRH